MNPSSSPSNANSGVVPSHRSRNTPPTAPPTMLRAKYQPIPASLITGGRLASIAHSRSRCAAAAFATCEGYHNDPLRPTLIQGQVRTLEELLASCLEKRIQLHERGTNRIRDSISQPPPLTLTLTSSPRPF